MKYGYSLNEEDFFGTFDDEDEAFSTAVADEALEPGDRVFIGECITHTASEFIPDGRRLVEDMRDEAWENSGDFAGNWLSDLTDAQILDLEAEVRRGVDAWAARHGLQPTFFNVRNVQERVVARADLR